MRELPFDQKMHREKLAEAEVIFCSCSHDVQHHPELIERYLGSVVPPGDNFYAALNSDVFADGLFVHVPEGVRCPMELSSYFRINARNTGQFERTLIMLASHPRYRVTGGHAVREARAARRGGAGRLRLPRQCPRGRHAARAARIDAVAPGQRRLLRR